MTDPTFGNAFVGHGLFTLAGAPSGPLSGMKFAAKDLYHVAGHPTGAGNPTWLATHSAPAVTASAVQRCLDAGATLAGKTLTEELAFSLIGANAHYGTPPNPAAPNRVPGGSSSGSASVVAQGVVDFALGTDTGGSVRIPASFCGLVGLRPTQGRIALDHVVPLAAGFDTVGWFTRDLATQIRVGAVLLGDDDGELRSDTIQMATDAWALADEDVREALMPVADDLGDAFAHRRDAPASDTPLTRWRELFRILQGWEVWQAHGAWVEAESPDFGPGVKERFDYAATITEETFRAAETERQALSTPLRDTVRNGTILCVPTSPCPAPLRSSSEADLDKVRNRIIELTALAGLAGLPQVTVPVATADNAPVGLSLIGAPGSDRSLLDLAARLFAQR